MGRGRSGEGGGEQTLIVHYKTGQTAEYRMYNGMFVNIQTGDELPVGNMSMKQIAQRFESGGHTVERFNAQQTKRRDEERNRERANRPDWELGVGIPGGNAAWRKVARRSRINNAAMKRNTRRR